MKETLAHTNQLDELEELLKKQSIKLSSATSGNYIKKNKIIRARHLVRKEKNILKKIDYIKDLRNEQKNLYIFMKSRYGKKIDLVDDMLIKLDDFKKQVCIQKETTDERD